jgi:hypothetical protein
MAVYQVFLEFFGEARVGFQLGGQFLGRVDTGTVREHQFIRKLKSARHRLDSPL